MKLGLKKLEKYKKNLKLLWILPFIFTIIFINKNFNLFKYYYQSYKRLNPEISFCTFNKTITNDTFFTIAIGNYILENGNDNKDHLTWHENLDFPHSRCF